MVNRLHLCCAFLTSGHSKRCTILPHIHPFIHTFTRQWRCQPCRVTASRQEQSGWGVSLSDTSTLGGAGDRTSNLPVTSQPTHSTSSATCRPPGVSSSAIPRQAVFVALRPGGFNFRFGFWGPEASHWEPLCGYAV